MGVWSSCVSSDQLRPRRCTGTGIPPRAEAVLVDAWLANCGLLRPGTLTPEEGEGLLPSMPQLVMSSESVERSELLQLFCVSAPVGAFRYAGSSSCCEWCKASGVGMADTCRVRHRALSIDGPSWLPAAICGPSLTLRPDSPPEVLGSLCEGRQKEKGTIRIVHFSLGVAASADWAVEGCATKRTPCGEAPVLLGDSSPS